MAANGGSGKDDDQSPGARLASGLARACGGALIFGLPMLMTMEMWEFGFALDRLRLALLLALSVPLLVGVAHRIGFEASFEWRDDLRDACLALGIGALTGAVVLAAFGVLEPGQPLQEIIGKVVLQAVAGAFGALLGRSQFGAENEPEGADDEPEGSGRGDDRALSGYAGAMFLMLVGALFLSLNVAPTEEMVLISYLMSPFHALVLVVLSVVVMHGFVFAAGFRGGQEPQEGETGLARFVRLTLPGYVLALAISVGVLWIFGRLDGIGAEQALMATVVLAFPAAVGAAAARLIL